VSATTHALAIVADTNPDEMVCVSDEADMVDLCGHKPATGGPGMG
jgi:hypothetical protein